MKLTVVNPNAKTLHESYGISEERSNEIGDQMDIISRADNISYAELQAEIAKICNTQEELAFALINNHSWLIKTGRIKL